MKLEEMSSENRRGGRLKSSVSIFAPTSIIGAFFLYFIVPTFLLLVTVQYVQLPPDLFLSSTEEPHVHSHKVVSTTADTSTHHKPETSFIQQKDKESIINVEAQSEIFSKTIHTKGRQPLSTTSQAVTGIDAHIYNARQVLRVSDDLWRIKIPDRTFYTCLIYHTWILY